MELLRPLFGLLIEKFDQMAGKKEERILQYGEEYR